MPNSEHWFQIGVTTAPARGKKFESEWDQKWQPLEALLLGGDQTNKIHGNKKKKQTAKVKK